MTKTVADNADMMRIIAGKDPKDPTSTSDAVPDYGRLLNGNIKGLRIGIPKTYFFDRTDPEVDAAVRTAIKKITDMGAIPVDVDIPHAEYAGPAMWIIGMSEASAFHEKRLKEQWDLFDPTIQRELGAAKFYSATDYIKANRIRTILQQQMAKALESCDVIAMPGGQKPARIDTPEQARAKYLETPPVEPRRGNTSIGNMTGYPSLVIPCGFYASTPTFPITIMFYGRPFDEGTMYRVAHAYETVTDWHKRRPPLATS